MYLRVVPCKHPPYLSTFEALNTIATRVFSVATLSTHSLAMSPSSSKRARAAARSANALNKRSKHQTSLQSSSSQRAPTRQPPDRRASPRRALAESQQAAAKPAEDAFEVELRESQPEVSI
jgi:hypothetical protein